MRSLRVITVIGTNEDPLLLTRRESLLALAAVFGAPRIAYSAGQSWDKEWDRLLIRGAVEAQDGAFDKTENMLRRSIGAEYHYHTALRSMAAHPTRDSLDYALLLFETNEPERIKRAQAILERMLAIQDVDPKSKWYGLWGYYLEEPASRMQPADFNWADFNGSLLLLIEARHGHQISPALRSRLREAIRHAAYSVRRRNVAMSYTNIAVQGTFVTLAAAELLGDEDLLQYAIDRFHRFAQQVDITGSFAEYNSPTYCNVTIANLLRIQMLVKNEEMRALGRKIYHREWLHLGKHWHVASKQLAGPMSRCYSTDIGKPLWIQKALGGRLAWVTRDEIRSQRLSSGGGVGLLPYHCPEEIASFFLEQQPDHQHRELFTPGVQGTTWLAAHYCLGSSNRGNFWVQSRPFVAYWPGGYTQMRFMKDDYDFASALIYSVQEKNYALALVNFRSPGGDKHPSLDPIKDGAFEASRLRVRFDIKGGMGNLVMGGAQKSVPATVDAFSPVVVGDRLRLYLQAAAFGFGKHKQSVTVENEEGLLTVSLDLMRSTGTTVRWADLDDAFAVLCISLGDEPKTAPEVERIGPVVRCSWQTPAGLLTLSGSTKVRSIAEQDSAFQAAINGNSIPDVRLSDERLS